MLLFANTQDVFYKLWYSRFVCLFSLFIVCCVVWTVSIHHVLLSFCSHHTHTASIRKMDQWDYDMSLSAETSC